ncbi:hypothetical protein ARSEF4850_003633 [Beauveria asiatica]
MVPDSNTEPLRHIRTVLIANRGEIAVRCIKACRELGVHSIAISTNADTTSLHAKLADESVGMSGMSGCSWLQPSDWPKSMLDPLLYLDDLLQARACKQQASINTTKSTRDTYVLSLTGPTESVLLLGDNGTAYTDSASILEICKRVGADAVIPGYGFLGENAEFADAVTAAGIVFVGPSSASIRAMGLKHEARAVAVAAHVPVIPGTSLLESANDACVAARALGVPVMLKATGGGGGMGLQVCHTEQQVTDAFSVVQSRGGALFRNGGVFLDKYCPGSRHVEVQVAGNGEVVVAFGERECSLQRRHQKVIEECPSPFVERRPGMREAMCQAATDYAARLSARVANILVGNEPRAELFEITLVGPELLFHEAAVVAVCGAEMPVTLQEQTQPMWSRLVVGKGQTLKLGRVGKNGTRTYLAVKGGFPQVAEYLGSRSTAPELGIGGVQGRKLQDDDILALDPQSGTYAEQASTLSLPKESLPIFDPDSATVIRCVDGPYGSEDILSPEGHAALYEAEWSVSHNSSRSGVRLSGPRLKWARTSGGGGGSHPSNVFDYGYPNGGVNFTGESPIIFAHDRPGLGGFACPTTVCSVEMCKVGQLKTGNNVRFRSISFDDALQLSKSKEEYLQAVAVYSNGGSCSHPRVTYRQGGDTSIIVEYGEQLADLRNTACVYLLLQGLFRAQLPGVRGEPNVATLTVHFNQQRTPRERLLALLIRMDRDAGEITGIQIPARQLRLPVCLDHSSFAESNQRYMENIRPTAAYMPDNVEYLRKNNALDSRQDVFDSILTAPWLTVAVGFFVGTPILYPLDPWRVITGQKHNPTRIYTPRGSIGLGGSLAAIYPVAAPGGYQLMGRTLGGWDAAGNRPGFSPDKPWLFNQFDLVKFHQVSEEEYTKIEQDFDAGRCVFDITETTINMDQYIAQLDEAARDPEYQEWKRRKEVASKEMAELEEKLYEEWVEAKRLATADAAEHEGDEESENVALIKSPVDANVWRVLVKEGDEIQKGQTVAILEAMKMEINIIAGEKEAGFIVAGIPQPPGSVSIAEHGKSGYYVRPKGQSPSHIRGPLDAMEDVAAANPWTIRLQTEVDKFSDVLPAPSTLPGQPKLSRFIAG